jgi:hypothetical protein
MREYDVLPHQSRVEAMIDCAVKRGYASNQMDAIKKMSLTFSRRNIVIGPLITSIAPHELIQFKKLKGC